MQNQSIETGDIYFFYRPKVKTEDSASSLQEVQRFYMMLHSAENDLYRLFVIGHKKLPEIHGKEKDVNWVSVVLCTSSAETIRQEMRGLKYEKRVHEGSRLPIARPAGEGVYSITPHKNHTHLAYVLELPQERGEVQEELAIEREASYVISVKNQERAGTWSGKQAAFPPELKNKFHDKRFIPVDTPDFFNYEGAEFLLIGASKDVSAELGIELEAQDETENTAEIFRDLKLKKQQHVVKPLFKGEWE